MLYSIILSSFFLFHWQLISLSLIEKMTIEEKVGQLLMVHFNGQEANEEAETLIKDCHVGSIIYYNWSNSLHSPEQVKQLSVSLQNLSQKTRLEIPLIIAIDQEGGFTSRLRQGFTQFPGSKALGETEDVNLAEACAFAMGQEMQAVGINMNLAPVVDINSHSYNPVIGIRSFGDNPETVISFANGVLKGFKKANLINCLKHFPGHGDVSSDSHEGLPILDKDKNQLNELELLPFKQLAAEADSIMTAHLMLPKVDANYCATLSKTILALLRKDIGFKGVIISDSLIMEGVLKNCDSIDEAVILAFNAGCDILMLGGKLLSGTHATNEIKVYDVQRIFNGLVDAVKNHRISEKRLNEAVERILILKEKISTNEKDLYPLPLVNNESHQQWALEVAKKAIKKTGNFQLPLFAENLLIIIPECVKDNFPFDNFTKLGKNVEFFFYQQNEKSEVEILKNFPTDIKKKNVCIFCSYNAWQNPNQLKLIQGIEVPLIVIILRDPIDEVFFPKADLILKTYDFTAPSLKAISIYLQSY